MKKYIIVGMFSFLLGAIVALGISNITQSPATPMAKESSSSSTSKTQRSTTSSSSEVKTTSTSTSSSEQSISSLYHLVPPQSTYKNLIVAKTAEAEAYIQTNGYNLVSKTNNDLNEKSLISEPSTELPNPVDISGKESYLYFWANDVQANELGAVRMDNKVVFFKATDDYLSRLN
ncbi:hypothetical protein [Lactococcus formosensis]|uniref:hypothetical protein n=1 Tax=Lactococcus formosensis TaxID=1281486 RepID=UPI0007CB9998|nr:hypothetical protein [Lactococcus formosensis]BAV03225.1 hypothetical protein NALG_1711 [Lactococcus formosensis]BDW49798.1 hypothetical protein LG21E20_14600 [Lactococcus formosensis]BDX25386.1 hypothetical protein LFMS200408A_14630 [Lactococcus formosensis]